jgi:orotidine-5'-phosphate decarboxylase
VAERKSQIVLGIDPDPGALWGVATDDVGSPADRAGSAILAHCRALIDATAEACVAVKLQLARFEVLGAVGWSVLEALAEHAREAGLLVIADGKRGDIDVTAEAYAAAFLSGLETPFGRLAGVGADLVTVNPLMGRDALEPFVAAARSSGAGVLVLVRTSNPGAADVEDLRLDDGSSVWERLAALVDELARPGVGASGISDVGAVVGATEPEHLLRARELMPSAPLLLPGVGAQGGAVEALAAAFVALDRGRPPRARRGPRGGRAGRGAAPASDRVGPFAERGRGLIGTPGRSASLVAVRRTSSSASECHREMGIETR